MYKLQSVPHVNGGSVTTYGEFSTLRDCTVAARTIQAVDPGRERYFSAKAVGDAFDSRVIRMSPGPYTADVEIVLSDGRIVWLGDIEEDLRKILDERRVPVPKVLSTEYQRESY